MQCQARYTILMPILVKSNICRDKDLCLYEGLSRDKVFFTCAGLFP
jgi:hypothetical protein